MDVLDLYAKISLDKSEYDNGLDEASEKTQGVGSKITGALKTAGKIGGVAIAAVGTAVTATTTALVHGVANVAEYGDNIDKMSQKMGLTAEAYQEWDAVMQHSGTSMESMQASMKTLANAAETGNEAFQKIGLTQEELANMSQQDIFEATIAGLQNVEDTTERTYLAGKLLGRGATELGALLNTSAADTKAMRDRVHELGGVMSDEAVKASAAFKDQLQDLSTGFSGLKRGLTSELLPSVTEVMSGLTDIFTGDYDAGLKKISSGIEKTVSKISDILPRIIEIGGAIIEQLAVAIVENVPKILPALVDLVLSIGDMIVDNLPLLIETGVQVILQLALGIAQALPELIPAIVEAVMTIAEYLIDNVDLLIDAAIALIMGLAEGLIDALPVLIKKIPEIIEKIVSALIDNIPKLVDGAIQLVVMLVTHLPEIIAGLIAAIPDIIMSILGAFGPIVDGLKNIFSAAWEGIKNVFSNVAGWFSEKFTQAKEAVGRAWQNVKGFFSNAWDGIKSVFSNTGSWFKDKFTQAKENSVNAWSNVKSMFGGVWERIKSAFSFKDALQWGKDMIQNFIDGIKSMFGKVGDAVKGVASKVKSFLGFSEPDDGPLSNFHTYAPDMMQLFAQGIRDNESVVTDQIAKSFDFGNLTGNVNVMGAASAGGGFENVLGRIEALLAQYLPNVQKDIVLDTGALVGGTVAAYDEAFGARSNRGGLR